MPCIQLYASCRLTVATDYKKNAHVANVYLTSTKFSVVETTVHALRGRLQNGGIGIGSEVIGLLDSWDLCGACYALVSDIWGLKLPYLSQ
jgi:hypothetical protein